MSKTEKGIVGLGKKQTKNQKQKEKYFLFTTLCQYFALAILKKTDKKILLLVACQLWLSLNLDDTLLDAVTISTASVGYEIKKLLP